MIKCEGSGSPGEEAPNIEASILESLAPAALAFPYV